MSSDTRFSAHVEIIMRLIALAAWLFVCTPDRTTQYHHIVDAVSKTEGQLRPPLSDDGRNYTNDAAVTWTLQAAVDQRVLLMLSDVELEEQDECLYDRVLMRNSTPLRPVCGRLEDGFAAVSIGRFAEVGNVLRFANSKR